MITLLPRPQVVHFSRDPQTFYLLATKLPSFVLAKRCRPLRAFRYCTTFQDWWYWCGQYDSMPNSHIYMQDYLSFNVYALTRIMYAKFRTVRDIPVTFVDEESNYASAYCRHAWNRIYSLPDGYKIIPPIDNRLTVAVTSEYIQSILNANFDLVDLNVWEDKNGITYVLSTRT